MKHLTKLFRATIAIAIMLCVALPTFAHDFEVNGIYYNYLDETAKTVEVTYKGSDYDSYSNEYTGAVSIPSSVTYNSTTYSVTSIGAYAFQNCSGLTSVTIPNSVTSIGYGAFCECTGLTELIIEDGKETLSLGYNYSNSYKGEGLFYDCPLEKLYLGRNLNYNSSVKYGYSPFYSKTKLKEVTIGNSITSIGDYAFSGCTGLTSVNFNAENCTSMGSSDCLVFNGCTKLKTLNIGNSVKTIPAYAFCGCTGLTSVTIPNSVTSSGDDAFRYCSGLTEVNITDLSAWCKIDFYPSFSNPLYYANKLKLNGTEIKDLVIPNDITEIKNYAFYNCSGLTSVTIPNSVTSIGDVAFEYCSGLTSITIPNSVTYIGDYAFYGTAWYNNLADGVIYINNVLYNYKGGMPNGTSISVKDGTVSISPSAFHSCSGLTSVTIPNSVTTIGDKAFYDCDGLTSVTIGNSVTMISSSVFYSCDNLRIVKSLSNTPQQCDDNAFGSNPAALLMVPKGSMVSYMIADGWRHFTKIQEFEVEDAVKQVLTIAYPEGGVIKQKVDNGEILMLQIVPANGWKCNSVTFNGIDVTNQLDANGNYNTPSITADSQLSIVFVKNDGGVESTLANDIKVCVNGNTVTILGADEFDDVEIYNTSGINVYNGIEKSITLDSNGIYILTVEGRTFKFAM